jgi:hypothetical protein
MLTGDDSVAPFGGAAFHDARVWAEKVAGEGVELEGVALAAIPATSV